MIEKTVLQLVDAANHLVSGISFVISNQYAQHKNVLLSFGRLGGKNNRDSRSLADRALDLKLVVVAVVKCKSL